MISRASCPYCLVSDPRGPYQYFGLFFFLFLTSDGLVKIKLKLHHTSTFKKYVSCVNFTFRGLSALPL